MSTFNLPATGIPLRHDVPGSPTIRQPRQTIQLNLSAKDTRDLVRSIKEGSTPRLKTGKTPEIVFGGRTVSLSLTSGRYPQEIFSTSADGTGPASFVARLGHTLAVRQAQAAVAGVDEALEKLKSNLKQFQDERTPTQPGVVNNKLLKPQHRPSPLAGFVGSRPSSPYLGGFSPRVGPTSAPLLSGHSKEEKVKLAAIRIPVIHLLAVQDQTPQDLGEALRVKTQDLQQVLGKVASDTDKGKKKLRDRAFRDLDVWKFPYKSQNDRQAAIDRAVSAFDRQRIDKTDNLWQMLLAQQDRGQNIYLSRLNFDKPLTTGNLTPKIPERSTDGGSTEGKSSRSAASEQATQKGKVPTGKPAETHNRIKPTAEKLARSLKNFGHVKLSESPAKKPDDTSGKRNVKYKSSEKVEDSDEEVSAVPTLAAATTSKREARPPRRSTPERTLSSSQKGPIHKPQLSSSSGSSSDADAGRHKVSATMVKTRGGKVTSDASDTASHSKSTHLPAPQSQNASRPRNGSSPAKPSPLGSSPPTNSRDVDSSSNSSKSTTLSSAPSSPPSTSSSSQIRNRDRSPIYQAQSTGKLTSSVKRKADSHKEATPAKKQHVNKGTNETERFNGLPKVLTDEMDHLPRSKRTGSDSDISSNTEKVMTKELLIDEARKFHKYYSKYKDLHEALNRTSVQGRDDADLDQVWKMHVRLKEMKQQIWRDWGKLEKNRKL